MALFYGHDDSAIESLPLQLYPGGANAQEHNHARSESLHSAASLSGDGETSDGEEHHESARTSQEHLVGSQTSRTVSAPRSLNRARPLSKYLHAKGKRPPNLKRILLHGLARCTISWILIAGFYISIWLFKDSVISPRMKSGFDAINVALSIAFGLNIASSLKEIALDLRWWFLDLRRRSSTQTSFPEVHFILECDSMTNLLKMMWANPRLAIIATCTTWLAINMLVQLGLASLSLTYSATPGPEDVYLSPVIGNISVPNFDKFVAGHDPIPDDIYGNAFAAHVLGDVGSSYNYSALPDDLEGSPRASNPAAFWNATDHWEYVSLNATPTNLSSGSNLAVYTDHIIRSSGVCITPEFQLSVTSIPGSVAAAKLWLPETNATVFFPLDALNGEGTYYLSSPYQSAGGCGPNLPGCGTIKVVETQSGPPDPESTFHNVSTLIFFYECNITVNTSPATFPGSPSAEQASIAARAIALSGAIPQLDGDWEYVFYNLNVTFGQRQNNSATGMASQLSRFAIGVMAAAARTNQPIIINGHVPTQGLRLTLDYPLTFDLILGLIAGMQLLLVLFTAFACRKVEIPEEKTE